MNGQRAKPVSVGGTDDLGSRFAWNFARPGFPVVVGPRSIERAVEARYELSAGGNPDIVGTDNAATAWTVNIVCMSSQFVIHQPACKSI